MGRKGHSAAGQAAPAAGAGMPRVVLLLLLAIVAGGLVLRQVLLSDSLWYDELYTIRHYTLGPWGEIVAGRYSPNNHVLSSLLVKATTEAGEAIGAWRPIVHVAELDMKMLPDDATVRFRLPSMVAGALAAAALAWPLRRRGESWTPWGFAAAGVLGAVHPWLLAFSTEARGYALVLLLAVLGTHLLRDLRGWRMGAYVACMAGALYTVPLAGLVVVGHAVAVGVLDRGAWRRFAVAAGAVLGLAGLLYLPFAGQMGQVAGAMRGPEFGAFVGAALRSASAGWDVQGWVAVAVTAVLLAGTALAWRDPRWRWVIVSFGTAAVLAVALGAAAEGLRQARFVLWLIPLTVAGGYGLVLGWGGGPRWMAVRALAGVLLGGYLGWQVAILARTVPQPILEALLYVKAYEGGGRPVVGVYTGAAEAMVLYHGFITQNRSFLAYDEAELAEARRAAGERPLLAVVFYPQRMAEARGEMAEALRRGSDVVVTFEGRISDTRVYVLRGGK